MNAGFLQVLLKGYRYRVLKLLVESSDAHYVREIARETDTHPGTLHKELAMLEKFGVIASFSRGNQKYYQLNCASPDAALLCQWFELESLQADSFDPDYVKLRFERIHAAIQNKIQFFHSVVAQDAARLNLQEIAQYVSCFPEQALVKDLPWEYSSTSPEVIWACYQSLKQQLEP